MLLLRATTSRAPGRCPSGSVETFSTNSGSHWRMLAEERPATIRHETPTTVGPSVDGEVPGIAGLPEQAV